MTLRRLVARLGRVQVAPCHPRLLSTAAALFSVHSDSHLDALDRRKRSASHRSKEFDTLGTWDTRLNVQIDEQAMLRTGHVVPPSSSCFTSSYCSSPSSCSPPPSPHPHPASPPLPAPPPPPSQVPHIDAAMVGVAEDVGRRTYQEDRHTVSQLRSSLLHLIHHLLLLSLLPPPPSIHLHHLHHLLHLPHRLILRPDLLYLAVFDGHGGNLCADYCQEHFERHILHHLDRSSPSSSTSRGTFSSSSSRGTSSTTWPGRRTSWWSSTRPSTT